MMNTHWKTDTADLRARACAVDESGCDPSISARTAARCLSGVIRLVADRHSVDAMQRACADLVRCDAAWDTRFGTLPRGWDGQVPEAIELIAVVARGILPLAGSTNMRAALAFWATEDDPSVWQRVAAGAGR